MLMLDIPTKLPFFPTFLREVFEWHIISEHADPSFFFNLINEIFS